MHGAKWGRWGGVAGAVAVLASAGCTKTSERGDTTAVRTDTMPKPEARSVLPRASIAVEAESLYSYGRERPQVADAVRQLHSLGFKVLATSGTQRFLTDQGIPTEKVNKVLEGRPHIVDAITNGEVQLVFNTTEGPQALADSRSLRRAALLHKVPYYTTLSGAKAAAQGIRAYLGGDLEVRTLQSYFSES